METVRIIRYFSESPLRGYCHPKYKRIRLIEGIKDRTFRTIDELETKEWYNPVKMILIILVAIAMAIVIADFLSNT